MSKSLLLVLGCVCTWAAGCSSTTADSMALEGNLAGALERYEEHETYDAFLKAGMIHQAQGEHGAAVIAFTRALPLNEESDYRVYQYRAESYLGCGEADLASADLEQALQRAPKVAQVHFLDGGLHAVHDRLQEARASYSRAIEYAGSEVAIKSHAYKNRAFVHFRAGDFRRAAADMEAAVQRGATVTSEDRCNLGLLLYAAGREDEAKQVWSDLSPADRQRIDALMHDDTDSGF